MGLHLRPYQQEIIAKVKADWTAGYTDVLIVLATGGGKTAIFLSLLRDELRQPGSRALILAHRRELVDQPLERLNQYYPDMAFDTGIIMAERNEYDKPLTAATVQSLDGERRLAGLLRNGPITHVVCDEAHHVVRDSAYDRILRRLREANPDLLHLGVTATPLRADGRGMAEMYQKVSAQYGIKDMIKLGYLVPPRVLAIQTGISLAGVTTSDGDYTNRGLHDVYETANCFDLVVSSHQKYADGRQAMAFTPTVDGAYDLMETFNKAGVPAGAADGTSSTRERQNVLTAFKRGELRVLCNAALWGEGLDIPQISCVHMVRPTKSDTAYIQRMGRALRPVPGKEDALILDYAPVEARNVVMAGDVLGVDAKKEAYLAQDREPGEVIGGFTFDGATKWLNGDPMELISRQLDYLSLSPWVWSKGEDGYMILGLGEGSDGIERTLVMSPPAEVMTVWVLGRKKDERETRVFTRQGSFEQLSDWVDSYANERGNGILIRKQANWRTQPASEKQIEFARRLGVRAHGGMSKGQCAELITRAMAMRTLRQYGVAA